MIDEDEEYVIDLCDHVLGQSSSRQYQFDFLCGVMDTVVNLPVDSYYEQLQLVIVYRLKQTKEDEYVNQFLQHHGQSLIILSYSDFKYDSNKRIVRDIDSDKHVVRQKLTDLK